MTSAAALLAARAALWTNIQGRAVELGYDPAMVEPICDGAVDAGGYLASKPRVMWILKEPYDYEKAGLHPESIYGNMVVKPSRM